MLVLDAAFSERFFLNPSSAAWEAGLTLSPIEVAALIASATTIRSTSGAT